VKHTTKKTIKNTFRTITILLLLSIIVGIGYTWFMGQTTTAPVAKVEVPTTTRPGVKQVAIADNVPVGVSVQLLTTPVAPGSNASITIKTLPIVNCTISVVYDKIASKDSGLTSKVSDEYGSITWAWTVEPTVPTGKWPVTVTCAKGKKSGVVIGDLVVSKDVPVTTSEE
jgi:hypothetical protein